MRVNFVAAALAIMGSVMLASGPASARTTAGEVVDDATLKAFVEGAAANIAAITNINEGAKLRDGLKAEGDWKSGSMFLIVFPKERESVHPRKRPLGGKQEPARRRGRERPQGGRGTACGRCPRRWIRSIP